VGTGDVLRARLQEAGEADRTALQWYTVKRGESLGTIARALGVRQADLAEANYLSTRVRVAPGQKLIIPRAPTTLLAARPEQAVPEATVVQSRDVVPGNAALAKPPQGSGGKVVYRVKRGDTLFAIARLFNTSVEALKTWNGRIQGTQIRPGDRLTIFAGRPTN
jgi:membrane-bound lytic murein transglycosylase D